MFFTLQTGSLSTKEYEGSIHSGEAAQQFAQGDCLPLQFLKLFAPAVLVLACRSFCWPGSALAQALGGEHTT
jgi:hypothetical protein